MKSNKHIMYGLQALFDVSFHYKWCGRKRKAMEKDCRDGSVNIYDIARMANVSIATVSRVMNHSGKVSEKTRKKVEKIMAEIDYTPNAFAQGLGLNTMHAVGIPVPTIAATLMAVSVD